MSKQQQSQPRPPRNIIEGKGQIKYVNSPNAVTVIGPYTKTGPSQEMVIFLENLDAPRMNSYNSTDIWAFYLRDELRKYDKYFNFKC
jgi:hypothetical protein